MKYKGTTKTTIAGFYSPYIPLQMSGGKRASWQSVLRDAHINRTDIETIETWMQVNFPGPYIIKEYYDPKLMSFDYRLIFEDPKQETMWRIKYE